MDLDYMTYLDTYNVIYILDVIFHYPVEAAEESEISLQSCSFILLTMMM